MDTGGHEFGGKSGDSIIAYPFFAGTASQNARLEPRPVLESIRASGCGNLEANTGGGRWRRCSSGDLCVFHVRRRAQGVSLVCADATTKPVQHGLAKLNLVLQEKGVVVEEALSLKQATGKHLVVIGLASGTSEAARLITEFQLAPGKEPEYLLIRKLQHEGKDLLLVAGSDARGLMYGLLDVADRAELGEVRWATVQRSPRR